ncbi:MAG: hypothetical protein ACRCUT_14650 [Spirochaetota bacterium]
MDFDNTSFLFGMPSFISGVARILDFGATFDDYNKSLTPEEADYVALRNDCFAVGNDMRMVMSQFRTTAK